MSRILVCLMLVLCACCAFSAETVSMTGTLVTPDGKPIAGAFLEGDEPSRSGVHGEFSVPFDAAEVRSNAASLKLIIYAPGYALHSVPFSAKRARITLQPGTSLSGNVTDEAGTPVAGVAVTVERVETDVAAIRIPKACRTNFTAVSDATGHWTLSDLPRNCQARVMMGDEYYAPERQYVTIRNGQPRQAVSLTARRSGQISGRVLAPDGAPASDARVLAFAEGRSGVAAVQATTDGRFRLIGLRPGRYRLRYSSASQAWIATPTKYFVVGEGQEVTIPDAHARDGAILDCHVLDAETGKPLPDATINWALEKTTESGGIEGSLTTDVQGHFTCHMLPGTVRVYVTEPPSGFRRIAEYAGVTAELHEGKTSTVTLKLQKGYTLSGRMTSEPLAPSGTTALLELHMPAETDTTRAHDIDVLIVDVDERGNFTVDGLPPGSGTIKLCDVEDPASAWELPEPVKFTLPAPNPVTVRLRYKPPCTVRGRVVDTHQQPLRGVSVIFDVYTKSHEIFRTLQGVTGDNGMFSLEKIPTGTSITLRSLRKKGYYQKSTGVAWQAGEKGHSELVMAPCTVTVHGVVRTPEGLPVPDAVVVSVEDGRENRAVTDAAGAFTLTQQPGGTLHLIAATMTGGGLATVTQTTREVTITCVLGFTPKPLDVPLALSLLDADAKLPPEQRMFRRSDAIRFIADIDLPLAYKLAEPQDAHPTDALRAYLLGKLAASDPAQAEKTGAAQLKQIADDRFRIYAAVELGIAMARRNPQLADDCYAQAKASYARVSHGVDFDDIEGFGVQVYDPALRIIALAQVLGKTTDLDGMLEQLNLQIDENREMIAAVLSAAGRVSPEFVFTVYDHIDSTYKTAFLDAAVCSMAQSDPFAARRLIQLIIAKNPKSYLLDVGPLQVVSTLGRVDPAAALALANELSGWHRQREALLLAACYQPKAAVTEIVQHCLTDERDIIDPNMANAIAANPESARTLYERWQTRPPAAIAQIHERIGGLSLNYAIAISPIDPREARLILEIEYARACAAAGSDEEKEQLLIFPRMMIGIDLTRARAMFESISARNDLRMPFGQAILRSLLLSPVDRSTF